MRLLVAIALIAGGASTGFGQVAKFRVIAGGRELGIATYTSRLVNRVDLYTKFELNIQVGGNKASMSGEYMTKSDGAPLWSVTRESSAEGTETIREDYGKKGVTVKKTAADGKVTTKTAKYPLGQYKSPSDLWFITTRPRPGTTEKAYSFSGSTMTWEVTTTKYVGVKTILVKGRSVPSHYITSPDVDVWVDSKGTPLKILLKQQGLQMMLERS